MTLININKYVRDFILDLLMYILIQKNLIFRLMTTVQVAGISQHIQYLISMLII